MATSTTCWVCDAPIAAGALVTASILGVACAGCSDTIDSEGPVADEQQRRVEQRDERDEYEREEDTIEREAAYPSLSLEDRVPPQGFGRGWGGQ
jgi:hypothetical protein